MSKKFGVKVIKRPNNLTKSKSIEFLSWKHAVNILEKKNIKFTCFEDILRLFHL